MTIYFKPQYWLFFCLLSLGLVACNTQDDVAKLSGSTMGTSYHITLLNPPYEINKLDLQQDIDIALQGLVNTFSTYEENSELSRLNQAPLNTPVKISAELLEVLLLAKTVSDISDGAFDITAGKLVKLWGFGPGADLANPSIPSEKEIREALENTGYQFLTIDEKQSQVSKQRDVMVDLSAIAKGYAVDKIASLLDARRIENYMVEIGGEVKVRGLSPAHKAWRLGVMRPDDDNGSEGPYAAINLNNGAIATSGDYFNHFDKNGQRYSHTINPKTGKPVTHNLVSVTVIADSVAYADAWATALDVLGEQAGYQLANQQAIKAFFIQRNSDGSLSHKASTALGNELEVLTP